MSDSVALSLIFLTATVIKEAFDRSRAKAAAVEVGEVKSDLAMSTTNQDAKLDKIHALVNSAMLTQLKLHLNKCETAAVECPTEVNKREFEAARQAFDEHLRKQTEMERTVSEGV